MGITIEQHRARIGAHNCIRINKYLSFVRGDVRHIILMLFQLVITIIVLAMFVRICYLNIYVRRFTQVIESFTQITGYIEYIPLLLRMANDVEETLGRQYMMWLTHLKQSVPILAKAMPKHFDKMLVNNV
jgi:hypothetical protein